MRINERSVDRTKNKVHLTATLYVSKTVECEGIGNGTITECDARDL